MSLEKRFQKLFNGQVVNENRIKGSVQICDEEMVKFAEWIIDTENKPKGAFTITELLEIYKQGL